MHWLKQMPSPIISSASKPRNIFSDTKNANAWVSKYTAQRNRVLITEMLNLLRPDSDSGAPPPRWIRPWGMTSFKTKFPVLQELFAKNHSSGARVNVSVALVEVVCYTTYTAIRCTVTLHLEKKNISEKWKFRKETFQKKTFQYASVIFPPLLRQGVAYACPECWSDAGRVSARPGAHSPSVY